MQMPEYIKITTMFPLGRLAATQGFMKKVKPKYAFAALQEHAKCHWGCVDDEDWQANNIALKLGERILSVYPMVESEEMFWIITEGDRSSTTFLLPSEY